jgi:hypothetical protein
VIDGLTRVLLHPGFLQAVGRTFLALACGRSGRFFLGDRWVQVSKRCEIDGSIHSGPHRPSLGQGRLEISDVRIVHDALRVGEFFQVRLEPVELAPHFIKDV